jgi:hypothetical protein
MSTASPNSGIGSSFSDFGINDDRNRSVIDELDLHVGAELAGLDWLAQVRGELADELLVERDGYLGLGGTDIGGAIPLSRAGEQGELADNQQIALHILDRKIHQALGIVEDAQTDNLPTQPLNVLGSVRLFHSQQHQKSRANGSSDLAINRHGCFRNTLNHSAHSINQSAPCRPAGDWPGGAGEPMEMAGSPFVQSF